MTVSQLVERFQQLPPDLRVVTCNHHGDIDPGQHTDVWKGCIQGRSLVLHGWWGLNVLEHGALCFCAECMGSGAPALYKC